MKIRLILLVVWAVPLCAQSNTGELRIKVTDPAGLGVKSSVQLVSEANQIRTTLLTDDAGNVAAKLLPFGVYRVEVQREGFAPFSDSVEVRSAIPAEYHVTLRIAPMSTSVTVNDADTLIDPHRSGTINRIGKDTIADRPASLPGRSVQDLVNTQPGWLYEGNAVLHPRGSEYQTQLVIDGIPLTDNRSPGFAPEIDADDLESMNVFTAGIPAEYGRKMGGVVEMTTEENSQAGFHGRSVLSGGSFNSLSGFVEAQYVEGKNFFGASVEGANTEHYLNPVVPENFTNTGTTGDFSPSYERQFTQKDRLTLSVR